MKNKLQWLKDQRALGRFQCIDRIEDNDLSILINQVIKDNESDAVYLCKINGHNMFAVYSLNNFDSGGKSSWGKHKCSRCGHEEDWQYDHV